MYLLRSRHFIENQRNLGYLATIKKLKALTEVKENHLCTCDQILSGNICQKINHRTGA